MNKVYICIDLKSFYASVECVERHLNPLTTNLVVADSSRTDKTICLAVTPSLKQYGLSGRSRLFEVVQKVREVNRTRKKPFIKKSYDDIELKQHNNYELDYITAPPRMSLYMKYSTNIYNIYLKYLSKEDIIVYSVDEIFAEITNYLKLYKCSPKELVTRMIRDVYEKTGITATAGIGSNMYLAKIAMDIVAKKKEADEFGVRIAELDENSYRKELWNHRPLTDFWRIGKGISKTLEKNHLYTMGDIARCSLENENKLFQLFGINAELLIDHAWGWEPCSIKEVKRYKPMSKSLSKGQVLFHPYVYEKAKIIVKEMIELLILEMVEKNLVTDQLVMTIGYDISNNETYDGEIIVDFYGRKVPKYAHGTIRFDHYTSSTKLIQEKGEELFEKIIDKDLTVRRINLALCNLRGKEQVEKEIVYEQLNLFQEKKDYKEIEQKENKIQNTIIKLKEKYGKNSILIGTNLKEGATTIERNKQVGGHKA